LNSLRRFALDAMEHFIVEIQTINYQSEVLRRLGPANVNRFITENAIEDFSRFRDERVSSIERAMVLCGYDERFGQTSTLNRIRWYLLGYLARHASFTIRARLGASDA
jgi:hypothetical protein